MRTRWTVPTAIAALGVWAGSAFAGGPTTYTEAKSLAAKAGKPLLLDFFTEW